MSQAQAYKPAHGGYPGVVNPSAGIVPVPQPARDTFKAKRGASVRDALGRFVKRAQAPQEDKVFVVEYLYLDVWNTAAVGSSRFNGNEHYQHTHADALRFKEWREREYAGDKYRIRRVV